jgi:tRNA threonylcarbamoyladenosine biosynthesis protein TsaB
MHGRGDRVVWSIVGFPLLNVLALDTSTPRAALAIATAAGVVHAAETDPAPRHGRNLIPGVRDLLRAADLTPSDLDLIAVGLGPGSYTGLRIGVTAAKTLAYALGKPLMGFDSLEAVARNAPADALRVSVIADAQRGDLYTADFTRPDPSGPLLRTAPTRIEASDDWVARLEPGTLVLGPGLERIGTPLPGAVRTADPAANRPQGRILLDLARDLWDSGRRDDPWFLEPLYLRRSAAEEQWDASRQ